jgi:acyl carrier protein phosphodiesterase
LNWLAHALVSEPDIEFRLGNFLADMVKRRDRANLSPRFLEGIRHHQQIDAFTDSHPAFHRSCSRIVGHFPHARGILVDIFYDHFLAVDWLKYCDVPLGAFTAQLYADIHSRLANFPTDAQAGLNRLMSQDWLGSYQHLGGIETALRRLSQRLETRLGRNLRLEDAMTELVANFEPLHADFTEFFPLLQTKFGRRREDILS